MRIEFVGVRHPMRIAKSLKRALAARGTVIGLRTCEELFAKMSGYVNWHELRAVCLRPGSQYLNDADAGEQVAAARRVQFIVKLGDLTKVSSQVAEEIIDELRPTGKRRAEPSAPQEPDVEHKFGH